MDIGFEWRRSLEAKIGSEECVCVCGSEHKHTYAVYLIYKEDCMCLKTISVH